MPAGNQTGADRERKRPASADGSSLRRAAQSDDRQVRVAVNVLDFHVEPRAGLPGDERVRQGTRRSTRPLGARFDARLSIRRESLEINLVGRDAFERRVRKMLVVPASV